jgi:predicted short-subunit dehydrogenase-like oxidoreductase (DUF2520 family)
MEPIRVLMVGTGNASSVLGRMILRAGHSIVAVAGRDAGKTNALASEWSARAVDRFDFSGIGADLCMLAVSDQALGDCDAWLHTGDMVTVHTAGSVSMDVLRSVSERRGVLYPLQSLNSNATVLPETPFLIDGSTDDVTAFLSAFARTLSSHVIRADDTQRADYHLAAVVCSNFTNHLLALAEDYCRSRGIRFPILQPLVAETVGRAFRDSPSRVQTGPAARNDLGTVERHLDMLRDMPELRPVYLSLTRSILERYGHEKGAV